MAFFSTYDSANTTDGNFLLSIREDLADFITILDPVDTPLFSMLPTVAATSIKHEWLQDTLAAAAGDGRLEGKSFSGETLSDVTRLANWTQIIGKDISITGTNQAVTHAGMADQVGYQVMKALQEIARHTEYSLIQNAEASPEEGDAVTARLMNGISTVAGNTIDTDAAGATDGTLEESEFVDLVEDLWDDGAMADTALLPAIAKRDVTGYTTTTRIQRHANAPTEIVANVMEYESDFGRVNIFLERHGVASEGYVFQKDKLALAVLRPLQVVPQAKRGDSEDVTVLHEATLQYGDADAIGKWTNLA